jgi:adenosine deaminase
MINRVYAQEMKMDTYCDLHLHLGGSISPELVRRFAQSDHDQYAIDALAEADVLTLFQVVHRLVRSPERVEIATEDVITTSTADYLEIRTTPRAFSSEGSFRPYVKAFVSALRRRPGKAKGILSIDRYKHDLTTARDIITLALEYPDCIIGIDISGVNPPGIRTLQGDDLGVCIETILDSPLGLAIHVGELESEKDQRDNTAALTAIDRWLQRHPLTTCVGKIRLGHAIFLSEEHANIIRRQRLPIEICPTCHRYLGCWGNGSAHPVQAVYPDHTSPVVLGTDNALNFSTSFQREKELFLDAFPYNPTNGWKYRFGQSHCSKA